MSVDIRYNDKSLGILPINKTAILSTKDLYMDYNLDIIDSTDIYLGEITEAIPISELDSLYTWSEV